MSQCIVGNKKIPPYYVFPDLVLKNYFRKKMRKRNAA